MRRRRGEAGDFMFPFLCGWALGLALFGGAGQRGYRAGQIDAIEGRVKYEKVVTDDGVEKWEKIKTEAGE